MHIKHTIPDGAIVQNITNPHNVPITVIPSEDFYRYHEENVRPDGNFCCIHQGEVETAVHYPHEGIHIKTTDNYDYQPLR